MLQVWYYIIVTITFSLMMAHVEVGYFAPHGVVVCGILARIKALLVKLIVCDCDVMYIIHQEIYGDVCAVLKVNMPILPNQYSVVDVGDSAVLSTSYRYLCVRNVLEPVAGVAKRLGDSYTVLHWHHDTVV